MDKFRSVFVGCAVALAAAASPVFVGADDKWELGGTAKCIDDDATSCNQLIHGQPQTHDLQGAAPAEDLDWMAVETKNRRSYEVRAFNSNQPWTAPATMNTTIIDRVDAVGTVLTAGFAPDGANLLGIGNWNAVRWIGLADQRDFIRVRSNQVFVSNANDQYDVELVETTYFLPRWNNSGTQVTVFLIQNTTTGPVTGSVFFYNNAGTLIHTEPMNVPRDGMQVINTSTIGALAGLSGHAHIAHLGGWGALSAKSVALEAATGFSFDTIATTRPR